MSMIEVRPVEVKKWHGKDGKESFAQPKTIEALYDNKTGKYATGMTEEEMAAYSKLMGTKIDDVFNPAEPHAFWSSPAAMIKLQNNTMLFDINKPADFIKVKILKASKFVANSLKDYEDNKYPDATHVIYDESEQVSLKAVKIQQKTKAAVIVSKMSLDDKIAIIQILSEKTLKGKSTDFIDVEIDDIVNNKATEFLKYAQMGRDEVHVRASVLELTQKNILSKEAGSFYYMGELIGIDYDATVEWFKNPTNQKMQLAILEKLNKV